MKKLILGVLFCLLTPCLSFGDVGISVPIDKIYSAKNYTDTDEVQIIITGTLPSECYHLTNTTVSLERLGFLKIVQYATEDRDRMCPYNLVTYEKSIVLGKLLAGSYLIHSDKTQVRATIVISRSSRSPQPYPAPVTEASIRNGLLHLKGVFPNPCVSLDRVDVAYQQDVISANPIMTACDRVSEALEIPFALDVKLDNTPKERFLLHVKTANGFLDTLQDGNL